MSTPPATAVSVVEGLVSKLVALAVKDLLPVAEGALPLPIRALVVGVLELPAVQDEIAHLEAIGITAIGSAIGGLVDRLKAAVDTFVHSHPALAPLWAQVEGSPIAGEVVSFAADEVKAFLMAKQTGKWPEVRAFLQQLGLLPASPVAA